MVYGYGRVAVILTPGDGIQRQSSREQFGPGRQFRQSDLVSDAIRRAGALQMDLRVLAGDPLGQIGVKPRLTDCRRTLKDQILSGRCPDDPGHKILASRAQTAAQSQVSRLNVGQAAYDSPKLH